MSTTDVDPRPPTTVALLDTTVQVDRRKTGTRQRRIDQILGRFQWRITTSISLLEFKATVIQQCITIHDQLRRRKRFTVVRDALLEKNHPQVKLRSHIFNNLIAVLGRSSLEITEAEDCRLADKARLRLERIIPALYDWFVKESVDTVLRDGTCCTRAHEAPRKKGVAFGVNIPVCRADENRDCRVEEFIRQHGQPLVTAVRQLLSSMKEDESRQLRRACEVFETVLRDATKRLSVSECRSAGDCLIMLEGREHATHAVSTNSREWKCLSELLGIEFVPVDYPDERTI